MKKKKRNTGKGYALVFYIHAYVYSGMNDIFKYFIMSDCKPQYIEMITISELVNFRAFRQ